jgi:hypothetical protein
MIVGFKKLEVFKKKKPIISDRLAPSPVGSCSYNAMIEYVTIRNLKG